MTKKGEGRSPGPLTTFSEAEVAENVTRELVELIKKDERVGIRRPFPQTGSPESFQIVKHQELVHIASSQSLFQAKIVHTVRQIKNNLELRRDELPIEFDEQLYLMLMTGTAIILDMQKTGEALPYHQAQLTSAAIEYLVAHESKDTPIKILVADWKKTDLNGRPNAHYARYTEKLNSYIKSFPLQNRSAAKLREWQNDSAFWTDTGREALLHGFTSVSALCKEDRIIPFFMKSQPQT